MSRVAAPHLAATPIAAFRPRLWRTAGAQGSIAWQRTELTPPVLIAFALLYGLVAELSGQLSTAQDLSPWYPPVGLSLCLVLVYGWRSAVVIPFVDAGQLLIRGESGTLIDVVLQALAQGIFWGLAGAALRPRLRAEPALSRLRDVTWFIALGVTAAPLASAFVGVALIFWLEDIAYGGYWRGVGVYFVGDAIGILSVAPALLVLAGLPRRLPEASRTFREAVERPEFWPMVVATIAVPASTICLWNGDLLPLAPLPVAWMALRLGMPSASLTLAVWSFSAVIAYGLGGSEVGLREISASMIVGGALAISAGAVVTERERGRARLAFLALHDELTGLPNHRGITESVADALARADRPDIAVLLVRLGGLPTPDGTGALDAVLLRAAHRLRRLTGPESTIARIGSRRFVVLVDGPDALEVESLGHRLVAGLSRPALVDGREYLLGPVVGTARGSEGLDAATVLERASQAAGQAHLGTRHQAAYDEAMQQRAREEARLARDLQVALDLERLHVVYQPIVDLASGLPTGAEALVRWDHPEQGPIGPNEFIPVAEAVGLILPLGRWVLREACSAAAAWAPHEGLHLTVHVNLSPVQLRDEAMVQEVQDVLAETGLPPGRLCLELTESGLFEDLDLAAARVLALTALGVSVVLDDFGTGYSSLSWLQRLPVSALKVDRSFVSGLDEAGVDHAIVSATLGLARTMRLDTVAEGVETQEQMTILRGLGCTSAQGYLLCRPVADEAFREWLSEQVAAA